MSGAKMNRLVDLVDRGPEDDTFFPASANDTIFRRTWPTYHNAVPDVVEIAYQGNAAWGQRITVPLSHKTAGDLLQWICLRIKPRSWLGGDLEGKIQSGQWAYTDPDSAWTWASSLGSIAIAQVELEINDVVVEKWPGEWMDVWSRMWLDGGRAGAWDSDVYAQVPVQEIRRATRPAWTSIMPSEDGYVYCWLPLSFCRRPASAFPLISVGDLQEIRLHITLRPFSEVVRRKAIPRTSPAEVPMGEVIGVLDKSGPTPVPYEFRLPTATPGFEDTTVLAGVVQLNDELRQKYLRGSLEMLYEPVTHMTFDVADKVAVERGIDTAAQQLRLTALNGPQREICWFVRRKAAWRYNEWTNYGRLLDDQLAATIPSEANASYVPRQLPLLARCALQVDNATWQDEDEKWWRLEYGLAHRGGIRQAGGMIYGIVFGSGAHTRPEDLQPAATVNASRADLRLNVTVAPPPAPEEAGCQGDATGWEVHVFGIGVNWLRFVNGLVQPTFAD